MLLTLVGLLCVVLLIALIVVGIILIIGRWKPFTDEDGNQIEFNNKEQWGVGIMIASLVIGIFAIFLSSDHPWVKKMKG